MTFSPPSPPWHGGDWRLVSRETRRRRRGSFHVKLGRLLPLNWTDDSGQSPAPGIREMKWRSNGEALAKDSEH
jgi:hypothetical protein